MSGSPQTIAGIRMAGRPDLLYVDTAGIQVPVGARLSIHTATEIVPGYVVIAADQLVARQEDVGAAVTGSLARRDGELVVVLTADPTALSALQIGAAGSVASQPARSLSIHQLYREYATPLPRLGTRMETGRGTGVVVALNLERGVFVVELDTGDMVEVERKA